MLFNLTHELVTVGRQDFSLEALLLLGSLNLCWLIARIQTLCSFSNGLYPVAEYILCRSKWAPPAKLSTVWNTFDSARLIYTWTSLRAANSEPVCSPSKMGEGSLNHSSQRISFWHWIAGTVWCKSQLQQVPKLQHHNRTSLKGKQDKPPNSIANRKKKILHIQIRNNISVFWE